MNASLKAALAMLALKGSRHILALMQRMLFKKYTAAAAGQIHHIVVFRVGNLGDTVVAIPAMYTLRQAFPKARITLLTSSGKENLVSATAVLAPFVPLVDDMMTYLPEETKTPEGLQSLKSRLLAHGKVDLFVDLPVSLQTFQRSIKEMLFARAIGSRFAVGFEMIFPDFDREEFSRAYPDLIPKMSDWLLSIVQKSLHKYAATKEYLNEELIESTLKKKTFWKRLNLSPDKPLLLVNAGAKLAIKQWPADRFAEVILAARKQYPQLQVGLLGHEGEHALNEEIRLATAQPYVENLCGKLDLSETALLIHASDAVLTNDTGTMHLAGLLNKPVLGIYSGQFSRYLWHPPGDSYNTLRQDVPCAPCFVDQCPFEEQICLTRITTDQVKATLFPTIEKAIAGRNQFLEELSGNS